MSEIEQIVEDKIIEDLGEYSQNVLIDSSLYKRVKRADYSISEYSGFNIKFWDKLGFQPRKNLMYYGLSLNEKALEIDKTSNKIEIPLLKRRDLQKRISKIKENDRSKIGWIYIGSIQMIISATFREGLDTPIDLAVLDNRLQNKRESILGIIRGNLKYQKLIFNIYPKIAYHINDKDFDKTLSLIQDFKRKDFMREGNVPYSITYKIAYAISNTHHIEYFSQKEHIDLPRLFQDIGRIYPPEYSDIRFIEDLSLDISDKPRLTDFSEATSSRKLIVTENNVCLSKRIILKESKPSKNYCIEGEYYNGLEWKTSKILIDTGSPSSYITKDLIYMLEVQDLPSIKKYINFDGEEFFVTKSCSIILRLSNFEIDLSLLVDSDDKKENIIILGMSFLEKCKPWKISSNSLTITIDNTELIIEK